MFIKLTKFCPRHTKMSNYAIFVRAERISILTRCRGEEGIDISADKNEVYTEIWIGENNEHVVETPEEIMKLIEEASK